MTLLTPVTTRRRPDRLLLTNGVILGVLGVIALARVLVGVTNGLSAQYFEPTISERVPVVTRVDSEISTNRVERTWLPETPKVFSVRWTGFLYVPRSGRYTFATTSDDGSTLSIDGRVVVDNGGQHGVVTKSEQLDLDAGPHLLSVEYVQQGGAFAMELAWAHDGGGMEPVPDWLLTAGRTWYGPLVAARVLDALRLVGFVALAVMAATLLFDRRAVVVAAVRRHQQIATLVLFVALAVLETWPLASNPAHLSRNDNGDTMLNEWTIAWVVHQAPRDPWHLSDANIFYPERNTLSYSESMVVQAAFAAPVLWLGGSPVLAYNLALLAGFALTGWTMSLVIARWTNDWAAGLLSGIVFAFNAHSLTRIPHLQAQHVEFLPIALFALDALLIRPRLRHSLALAGWFVLQALTSIYLMVFTAVALLVATLVRPEEWIGARFRSVARYLIVAGALATVLLLPYVLPYWRLRYQSGIDRPLHEVAYYGATWRSYLGTPSRVHFPTWSHRWFSGDALFPGVVGLALSIAVLFLRNPWRDRRVRMCLAIGVCGVALSFGPAMPGYALLYRLVPPLQGIRAVARFGYLGILAVALLAGLGFASIRQRLSSSRSRAFAAIVVPLALVESLVIPIGLTMFRRIPPIYERLRDAPAAGAVVEIPLYPPEHPFGNAKYMLASTVHWRRLVNGYSGFAPPSYDRQFRMMQTFPAAEAIAAMQAEGITGVIVHVDAVAPATLAQVDRTPQLHRVAADGPIAIYGLDRPAKVSH